MAVYKANIEVVTKNGKYGGIYNSEFNNPTDIFMSIINSKGEYLLLEDITNMEVVFIKQQDIESVMVKIDSIKEIQVNEKQAESKTE